VQNKDAGLINNTTINDSLTSTLLTDTSIAIYILGESSSGGYTRFTTSQNAPSWWVGTGKPASCSTGSLYSDATTGDLSVCKPNNQWVTVLQ